MSAPAPAPRARTVEVRPLRRRDLRGVLAIEGRVYPRPWSASLFLSELAQVSARCYLVARAAGTTVGYGGIMLVGQDAHVTTLAVDPDRRRAGVGSRLLLALAHAARRRGCTALTLEVRRSNQAAQALYGRFGFEAVGVRRRYYRDNGEDAVVMWARSVDGADYAALLDAHARRLDRDAGAEW